MNNNEKKEIEDLKERLLRDFNKLIILYENKIEELKYNYRVLSKEKFDNFKGEYATLINRNKTMEQNFIFGKKYKIIRKNFNDNEMLITLINEKGQEKTYSITNKRDKFKLLE